jgi:hypothetical protein
LNPEDYLRYEPDTGKLYWLPRTLKLSYNKQSMNRFNTLFAGTEALVQTTIGGYKNGKILGETYYAHVVIWRVMTGIWPEQEVDHIDRDVSNNKWGNLREASTSQNRANRSLFKTSLSGFKGVRLQDSGRWQVRFNKRHIGTFNSDIEAAKAYDKLAREHYGNFALLNFGDET